MNAEPWALTSVCVCMADDLQGLCSHDHGHRPAVPCVPRQDPGMLPDGLLIVEEQLVRVQC